MKSVSLLDNESFTTMKNGYGKRTLEQAEFRSYHPQVVIHTPDGIAVFVDEKLANLFSIIWDMGFETRFSCSGGSAKDDAMQTKFGRPIEGYIYFEEQTMASIFTDVVKGFHPCEGEEFYLEKSGLNGMTVRFQEHMIPIFEESFQSITLHHPAMLKLQTFLNKKTMIKAVV